VVRIYGEGAHGGRSVDSMFRLVVEDQGIGFDEKYLDRIFTVFQRLHGRTEYEGTGIGLAICRKIAQCHGGDITANSTPGQGASFAVTLPYLRANGNWLRFTIPQADRNAGILAGAEAAYSDATSGKEKIS